MLKDQSPIVPEYINFSGPHVPVPPIVSVNVKRLLTSFSVCRSAK